MKFPIPLFTEYDLNLTLQNGNMLPLFILFRAHAYHQIAKKVLFLKFSIKRCRKIYLGTHSYSTRITLRISLLDIYAFVGGRSTRATVNIHYTRFSIL